MAWWDDAARVKRLKEYCRQDVIVERALDMKLAPLSATERKVWELDQLVNNRRVRVDAMSVAAAVQVIQSENMALGP
jgi:DNA polymerase